MKPILSFFILVSFISLLFIISACSGKTEPISNAEPDEPINNAVDLATDNTPVTEDIIYDDSVVLAKIDLEKEFQTMIGFGAGYTWYSDWALKKPQNKEEIADLLFKDAKMTILRFKNEYQYNAHRYEIKNDCRETQFYNLASERVKEYGEDVTVLMSCWSPPANIKSNDSINGGGTIKKDENGAYMYDEYGKWWAESVDAYTNAGVKIDYVSIQNECDFTASYDGMELAQVENDKEAEYGKAYLSVYEAMKEKLGVNAPLMLGPETMTFSTMDLIMYMKPVLDVKPESVSGIAFHLYLGGNSGENPPVGSTNEPDSFNKNFRNNYDEFGNKFTLWQTEFFRGTPLQTAMLINNSLVNGNLNAYIFWGGIWEGSEAKNDVINVNFDGDYWYGSTYYVMRHFSEFIRPGYKRVQVNYPITSGIRVSAFKNTDGTKLAVVLINPTNEDIETALPIDSFSVTDSVIYQTTLLDDAYDKGDYYNNLGKMGNGNTILLKAKSITTIDITGN